MQLLRRLTERESQNEEAKNYGEYEVCEHHGQRSNKHPCLEVHLISKPYHGHVHQEHQFTTSVETR